MSSRISRRAFARLASAAALAPSALRALAEGTATGAAGAPAAGSAALTFPRGFLWGSATASYQVEGAATEDGRGPSIWDTFSHTPGKTYMGDTGDVADDHYHRYSEDIKIMNNLGLKTARFSISWSRVFPTGTGAPNPKGLDFYNRMIDALLAADIQPYCTLYHWDLPQTLQDNGGGWENRDTAQFFGDYAGYVATRISDRVKHFMTTNEIRTFVEVGNKYGSHAPGLKLPPGRLAQLNHHAVLGHGMAVQAIRAAAKPGTKVGLAENALPCVPVIETPEHIEAATLAIREENASFLSVILDGRYSDLYLKRLGADAPKFTAAQMKIIGSPVDFVGLNVYDPIYIRASRSEKGYAVVPNPPSYPHMYSSWLNFGPDGIYWSPKLVNKIWGVKELYITENGCSSTDTITPEGEVYDTDRVMFLRSYLRQVHRAVSEGVPIKGYFLWSLLDNFEWADGYSKRFGITYVDFKTQKRSPKLSSHFYKEVIARNGLA